MFIQVSTEVFFRGGIDAGALTYKPGDAFRLKLPDLQIAGTAIRPQIHERVSKVPAEKMSEFVGNRREFFFPAVFPVDNHRVRHAVSFSAIPHDGAAFCFRNTAAHTRAIICFMVLYTVAAEIAGQPVKNLLIKSSKGSEWMKHLIRV